MAPRCSHGCSQRPVFSRFYARNQQTPGALTRGFLLWGYQELNLGPHPYQASGSGPSAFVFVQATYSIVHVSSWVVVGVRPLRLTARLTVTNDAPCDLPPGVSPVSGLRITNVGRTVQRHRLGCIVPARFRGWHALARPWIVVLRQQNNRSHTPESERQETSGSRPTNRYKDNQSVSRLPS